MLCTISQHNGFKIENRYFFQERRDVLYVMRALLADLIWVFCSFIFFTITVALAARIISRKRIEN